MDQAVVELLIDNIISILANEASLLWGTRDAIEDIKEELKSMRSFLVDADRKGVGSEGEKTWVANVRDMAYDVEDIIDEFMYHINYQRIRGRSSWILHHTIYFPKNLWVRHQTATKIQKINGKIKGIRERNQRYDINHIEGTSSKDNQKWLVQHAESALFFKEEKLVGIEKKRKKLMGWLMDGVDKTVISIVGMGGSGKTTLVANTYNNDDVKKHFKCCAWITISQAYELEDLLRSMVKRFYKSMNEADPTNLTSMKYTELVEMLVDYLKEKRYLLVLDDVWDTSILNQIKLSILDNCHMGRIILTTRKENVASFNFEVTKHVYHIQPLEEDEAWDLFYKKAFSSSSNICYSPDLVSFAQELVRKCEGLPLAIAALGSLMYSKNESQWTSIYNSLNWSLNKNPELEMVKTILLLSFKDLPHQLKHCFLYCSLFPEDYEIRRKRLIKLWMAEGFVEQVKGFTPEEVADSYLEQLIFRSMLQVVDRNEFGRPKACKMHDLMREVALPILEKQIFGVIYDGGEEMEKCKARHMSIHKTDVELKLFMGMSKLRSFLVFNNCKALPSGSKMLRVLDLQDVPIDELPDEVVNFFNLKYLNLRGTLLKRLPNSIGRLLNLQTLDIRNTQIEALPRGIGNLQNLRHLIMYRYTRKGNDFRYVNGTNVPSNISRLTNLQSVSAIESNGDLMQQIRGMTQLTRIGISNVKEADGMDLCLSIQNMKLLHYLFIMATNAEETLRMDSLSAPPPNLRVLILVGKLEKVPRWFLSLQSVTSLYLHWSRLEEDLLPHIAALPNLGSLTLINAYVGRQLCFNTGFLELTKLYIANFPQLNEIKIEKGVMPNLKSLDLDSCMELKTVPLGIEYLQNLQLLKLKSVPMELENRIGNEDFRKVQHIPEIYIWD
ncbi:hypothetical protein ACB094_12G006600 [Castanea mollissima]